MTSIDCQNICSCVCAKSGVDINKVFYPLHSFEPNMRSWHSPTDYNVWICLKNDSKVLNTKTHNLFSLSEISGTLLLIFSLIKVI